MSEPGAGGTGGGAVPGVHPRFGQFPRSLAEKARMARLGDVPVMLVHPDWEKPAPVVLWMHGRTASKEIDPGRYLRWMRAGIAACAIDLPGHGERYSVEMNHPRKTLEIVGQMVGEIDGLVERLAAPERGGLFDTGRMGIGGMSAGGMATLRRLCGAHTFRCAAVEGTSGWLSALYFPEENGIAGKTPWGVSHDKAKVEALDASLHMQGFRPLPLLALHSEADRIVPVAAQRAYIERLREHYAAQGADPAQVEFVTWPETGALEEHSGFGRVSNEAKNLQVEFFQRALGTGH